MITEKVYVPKIVLKYVAKKFVKTVLMTSLILLLVLMLADSLELSRKLASKDVADSLMLKMLVLKAPDIYIEILPFAFLIGTLMCFSGLAKTSELVAIRSSGISAWQFLLPSFLISFVLGIMAVLMVNPLAAHMQRKYEVIEKSIYPEKAKGIIVNGQELYLKYAHENLNFVLNAKSIENQGMILHDVSILFSDDADRFIKRITSSKAELVTQGEKNYWSMDKAVELKEGERKKEVIDVLVPTQMTPEKIKVSFSSPRTLTVYDLPEFIESLDSAGISTQEHKVRFVTILLLPFLCVAMFILAAPFALHFSRKGGVGKLLLSGLCFGFVFYMFNNIILTLAQAGRLNIYIAVIIPILIAGLIGVYMLLHFREE